MCPKELFASSGGSLYRLLLMFPLLAAGAAAQSTALLTGTVIDPSGSVVPAARVLCRNVDTDLKLQTVTNNAGLFRVPDVPVGSYELTISKEGFSTLVQGGIKLFT